MTLKKALRFAVARSGDMIMDTPVSIRDFTEDRVMPDDLNDELPEHSMVLRLMDDNGSTAIAVATPPVLGAIIEAGTIGVVTEREVTPRAPTRTDAMLCAGFLNSCLENLAELAAQMPEPPPLSGYAFASKLTDMRAAQMAMSDTAHLRLQAEMDFGLGAKVGALHLIFPAERVTVGADEATADDWTGTMERTVLGTQAKFDAEIARFFLPLSDITGFQVDDVIPLHGTSVDDVRLIGSNGSQVLAARLGRAGPVRAVRLKLEAGEDSKTRGGAEALAAPAMDPLPAPDVIAPEPVLAAPEPELAADLPPLEGDLMDAGGDLPPLDGGLPPLDGGLPDLDGGGLPPLDGGLPDLDGGGLPDLDDSPFGGDLPPL